MKTKLFLQFMFLTALVIAGAAAIGKNASSLATAGGWLQFLVMFALGIPAVFILGRWQKSQLEQQDAR